jgi:hypothetical protein
MERIKMKFFCGLTTLVLTLTFGIAMPASAQNVEQVWISMQEKLRANQNLVAYVIDSRFETPGDAGQETGTYKRKVVSASLNEKPLRVYSAASTNQRALARFSELDFGLSDNIANYPAQLFPVIDSMEFSGKEKIDNDTYSIIKIHAHHPKANFPIIAQVWVGEKDAHLLRVRGTYQKLPIPGMKDLNFAIEYATDAAGRSLPVTVDISYKISIFFHSGDFSFSHRLSDWREKSQ